MNYYQTFQKDQFVEIYGADYKPSDMPGDRVMLLHTVTGAPFVCPDENGVVGLPSQETFNRMLHDREATVHTRPSPNPAALRAAASQATVAQVMKTDPYVEKMLAQVEILDEAGVPNGDKAISNHLAKHWTEKLRNQHGAHDPARTIRRWRVQRGAPGRRHPREFVRQCGRTPRGHFAQDVPSEVLAKHVLEYSSEKGRFADHYAGYVAEASRVNLGSHPDYLLPPEPYRIASKDTFRRWCNALEGSATVAAKHGEQMVEQDWRGAGRPLDADFCMQRVIVDHTKIDVHAVDDEREMVFGRAWLTIAIDVRSRAIVAHVLSFMPPSEWTVVEILKRIALPKRPPAAMAARHPVLVWLRGRVVELILDNATEFRGSGLAVAARTIGFHVRFCPIKKPRYRAIVERALGTINRALTETLPGRVLPPADARRLGHEPEKEACVLIDEIEALLNQVVAEYNVAPHDGLAGRQPAMVFGKELAKRGVMNVADLDSFQRDVMPAVPGAQLSPSGIRWQGLRYHCIRGVPDLLDDLVPLEPRRRRRDDATATVEFRYDPLDIGRIHVWNRKTKAYVTLVCADRRYADGLPLAFHEQLQKATRDQAAAFNTEEERLLVRARRIEAIRNIDPKAKAEARKRKRDLLDVPRVRQVVGNVVHLFPPESEAAVGEFIASDRAGLNDFDRAVTAPTPPRRRGGEGRGEATRDRRDGGSPRRGGATAEAPTRRRRSAGSAQGDYK